MYKELHFEVWPTTLSQNNIYSSNYLEKLFISFKSKFPKKALIYYSKDKMMPLWVGLVCIELVGECCVMKGRVEIG